MRVRTIALLGVLLAAIPVAAFSATRNISINRISRGDWTYNALALLAAHGHAAGLPARYFQGDRLFTRPEMAELVARIAEKRSGMGQADKVALKALALDLWPELLSLGMTESMLKEITDVPEIESPAAFTASLGAISRSDEDDETFGSYDLSMIGPFGPHSFLTGTYTNEAREFRSTPEAFSKFDIGSYKLLLPNLQVEAGRNYVRWGPGYSGSMILGDNVPAFDMLRFRKNVKFPFIGKVLIDQFAGGFQDLGDSYAFLGRRYEKTFSPRLNVAVSETVKTSHSLNPLILVLPFYTYQQMFTDVELEFNTLYSIDLTYTRRRAQGYVEFLVDDMTAPRILDSNRFRRPRKTGYLLGVYLPDPLKTGRTSLRAEYILVNPETYEAWRPDFPGLAYTRDGLVIGHPIGANSNALFLRADHWLTSKTQLIVEYLDRSPRRQTSPNALDFSRLDAYLAHDIRPWASLTARYVRQREGVTDNTVTVGASITY